VPETSTGKPSSAPSQKSGKKIVVTKVRPRDGYTLRYLANLCADFFSPSRIALVMCSAKPIGTCWRTLAITCGVASIISSMIDRDARCREVPDRLRIRICDGSAWRWPDRSLPP
jgi:hypothetical protein